MYFIVSSIFSLEERCAMNNDDGMLCVEIQDIPKYINSNPIIWEILTTPQSALYIENDNKFITHIIVNKMYDLSDAEQLLALLSKDDGFKLLSKELFFWAASYNFLNALEYLAMNFDFYDHIDSALKYASTYGNYHVIIFLIEIGANINYDDNYCIKIAIRYGYLEIVKLYVSMGVHPQIEDNYLIKHAITYNRLAILDFLLVESKINYKMKDGLFFKYAISCGHLDIVKYFVDLGFSPRGYNNYPLRCATRNNYVDIIKYLIDNNVNIRIDNDKIIKEAINQKQWEIVSCFLIHINFNV